AHPEEDRFGFLVARIDLPMDLPRADEDEVAGRGPQLLAVGALEAGHAAHQVDVAAVLAVVVPARGGPRRCHDGPGPGVLGCECLAARHPRRGLTLAHLVPAYEFHR